MPIQWHKNGTSMPMTCKRKSDTIVLSTSGFFFGRTHFLNSEKEA